MRSIGTPIYYRLPIMKTYTHLVIALLLTACSNPEQPGIGFYLALQRGDIEQIERHIEWGTDVNHIDKDGSRPLQVAARLGNYAVVKLLLKNGGAIDALDREGRSALYAAIMAGKPRVAEILIRQGAELDADRLLDQAVANDITDRDVIQLLVRQGADINHLDTEGHTPLMQAIKRNNRVLAKHLIARGADVNKEDSSGKYPLALAEELGDEDIIRLLRRNGARHKGLGNDKLSNNAQDISPDSRRR